MIPYAGKGGRLQLPIYNSLDEIREAASSCTACERSTTRQQVVFGAGNRDAAIMLVGEAPSSTDDRTGKPFTGPAGDLLDELLHESGTSRDEIWITNLVRCYAGRERDGRSENRPVRARELAACRTWLNLEIQYVDPTIIVAVGAPAARELCGAEIRLAEDRGKWFERSDNRSVIPIYQPAYVMRLGSIQDEEAQIRARELLLHDLTAAVRRANGD